MVNIAVFFDPVERKNKVLRPEITDFFQPQQIFCTFGGSEHNVFGLLEAPKLFDFVTDIHNDYDQRRQFVPYQLIEKTLERAMRGALTNLSRLREFYSCPITQICTPPAFSSIDDTTVLPTVFQGRLQLGITPAPIRQKLHYVHTRITRFHCERLGVNFLPPPETATDSQGYLRRELWTKDPTHGNREYGKLVLNQIMEIYDV
ncbi:hypothetical protein [Microvirga roseola]|uniref:hypothetical protein n=1 Tax=Microvirga roseola TaxID=2883126 RepID=UPI001E57C5BD|nr:hypothetical protein [Microvirga roseola]